MSPQQAAAVGDIIETQVQHPHPRTLACQINSPASCAHANHLIQSGRWGRKRGQVHLSRFRSTVWGDRESESWIPSRGAWPWPRSTGANRMVGHA